MHEELHPRLKLDRLYIPRFLGGTCLTCVREPVQEKAFSVDKYIANSPKRLKNTEEE